MLDSSGYVQKTQSCVLRINIIMLSENSSTSLFVQKLYVSSRGACRLDFSTGIISSMKHTSFTRSRYFKVLSGKKFPNWAKFDVVLSKKLAMAARAL